MSTNAPLPKSGLHAYCQRFQQSAAHTQAVSRGLTISIQLQAYIQLPIKVECILD